MTARAQIAKCTIPPEIDGPSEQMDFPSLALCGKPQPVNWLIPGLVLESMVNVIQGKKSVGKSCYYAWVIAVYIGVIRLPGRERSVPKGRKVLLASEEPYRDLILPRLKALGVKPASVLYAGKTDGSGREGFCLPDCYERVERAVKTQGVGLFVCDSLAHFLPPGQTANDEGQIREALEPAIRLGENDGLTSLFTQHLRKSRADSEIEQGRGSGATSEVARCVGQLQRKAVNPTAGEIKCVGANAGGDGRRWEYSIQRKGQSVVFTLGRELNAGGDVDLAALGEAAEMTKFKRSVDIIKSECRDGEKDSRLLREIADQWGIGYGTLWSAAEFLGVVARRVGKGKQCRSFWSLPKAGKGK